MELHESTSNVLPFLDRIESLKTLHFYFSARTLMKFPFTSCAGDPTGNKEKSSKKGHKKKKMVQDLNRYRLKHNVLAGASLRFGITVR